MGVKRHKTVFELTAENRKLNQKLKESQSEFKKTGKEGNKLTNQLKTRFLGAAAAVGTFIVGLIKSIRLITTFDKGMRNVNSILGLSEQKFKALSSEVLKVQAELGLNAADITEALYQAVSAGVEVENAIDFLRDAGKVGIAGVASTTEAVDILTTVLNAYHLETEESGKVSDILFQTIKLGKTNLAELSQSLAMVAPLAAANNISFEELSAALATLTKQGVKTPQAVTQIRSSIIGLNSALGDGWSDTMTYQEGVAKVAEMAGGSQNKLKKMLLSIEAVNGVLGLAGENAKVAADDLDAMNNSFGAATEAFEEQSKALQKRWGVFIGSISAGVISFGKSMADLLLPIEKLESATSKMVSNAARQKTEFLNLANTLKILAEKTELTNAENKLYQETIDEIQKKYPNYLENINFEKDGYNEIASALDVASEKLEDYLQKKIKLGIISAKENEIVAIGVKLAELEQAKIEQQAEALTALQTGVFQGIKFEDRKDLEFAIESARKGAENIGVAIEEQLKIEQEKIKTIITSINKSMGDIFTQEPGGGDTGKDPKETIKENFEVLWNLLDETDEKSDTFVEHEKERLKIIQKDLEDFIKAKEDAYQDHVTTMTGYAQALGAGMAEGANQEGLKGAFKSALMTTLDYVKNEILLYEIVGILRAAGTLDFSLLAKIAAVEGIFAGLKGEIANFAKGVENYQGGLAYVHKDEMVRLPSGTNVHTKSETARMIGGGNEKIELLLGELIQITKAKKTIVKGKDIYEIYHEAEKNVM